MTDDIDNLVKQYNNGDKESAMQLIETFKPYIYKYLNLLKYNKIQYGNDVRRFLALFVSDIEVRKSIHNKKDPRSAKYMYETCSLLNMQLNYVSAEDLEQDMYSILLVLATRYKDKNKSFAAYVYNAFIYELKRTVESYIMDPLNSYVILDENITYANDDDLDDDWVNGITCNYVFEKLKPIDRQILKLYYDIGYTDKQIADILGMHKQSVYRKRHNIINKVKEAANGK